MFAFQEKVMPFYGPNVLHVITQKKKKFFFSCFLVFAKAFNFFSNVCLFFLTKREKKDKAKKLKALVQGPGKTVERKNCKKKKREK